MIELVYLVFYNRSSPLWAFFIQDVIRLADDLATMFLDVRVIEARKLVPFCGVPNQYSLQLAFILKTKTRSSPYLCEEHEFLAGKLFPSWFVIYSIHVRLVTYGSTQETIHEYFCVKSVAATHLYQLRLCNALNTLC